MKHSYIGIQGGPGSFHEAAALEHYPSLETDKIAYIQTFPELFDALQNGTITRACAAIANNRYGFISDTYNHLTSDNASNIWIAGETYVRVEHQLLGIEGMSINSIKEVHSQAPALGQCKDFLRSVLPHVLLVEQDDTALSAEIVAKQKDPSKVAIASSRAGAIHGLQVIAPNIQDDADNITRFLALEKRNGQKPDYNHDKSTVLLTTSQNPGSLADALIPFKVSGINISMLHSTFVPNTGFDMRFFLEYDAGQYDDRVKDISKLLVRQGCAVEYLGSYSRSKVPLL